MIITVNFVLQVALLDVDICGPSLARMLGVQDEAVHESADGWSKVFIDDNLSVMSIAFLLQEKNDAVIWRGPRKNQMIKKFLMVAVKEMALFY